MPEIPSEKALSTKIGHVLVEDFIYHNYLGFLSELKQNVFNRIQAKKTEYFKFFFDIKEHKKKPKYRILHVNICQQTISIVEEITISWIFL